MNSVPCTFIVVLTKYPHFSITLLLKACLRHENQIMLHYVSLKFIALRMSCRILNCKLQTPRYAMHACVYLCTDHQTKGRLAGVQFSAGCRRPLHLYGGGTRTELVLQRCKEQTAPPATGEGVCAHNVCLRTLKSLYIEISFR